MLCEITSEIGILCILIRFYKCQIKAWMADITVFDSKFVFYFVQWNRVLVNSFITKLKAMFCNFYRTINNNNLSTLPDGLFQDLYRLRTLRILENNFKCDCRLAWLAKWLRKFPKLGQYTKCASPGHLKGQSVADLHEQEFKCSGM